MQAELQNGFTSLFISTWIYEIFPCLLPIFFGKENVYGVLELQQRTISDHLINKHHSNKYHDEE